jgi:hypothetical protein
MNFEYKQVERIPQHLDPGVIYHSEDFELASLLCACGCGHKIVLLVPDSHQVYGENGMATVHPSIGVFDGACKSHYVIRRGHVQWLPAFSGAQADVIMQRQIARHVAHDAKKATWLQRLGMRMIALFETVKSFIRR